MPPPPSCFWQWSIRVLLLLVMMPGRVKEEGRNPTPCHNAAPRAAAHVRMRIELKGRCLAPSYSAPAAAPTQATHQPQQRHKLAGADHAAAAAAPPTAAPPLLLLLLDDVAVEERRMNEVGLETLHKAASVPPHLLSPYASSPCVFVVNEKGLREDDEQQREKSRRLSVWWGLLGRGPSPR